MSFDSASYRDGHRDGYKKAQDTLQPEINRLRGELRKARDRLQVYVRPFTFQRVDGEDPQFMDRKWEAETDAVCGGRRKVVRND